MNELLGLVTTESSTVPLVGVSVKGDILGRGARVQVFQRFRNREKKPVEAVYKFPLPEGAAICGFSASIDGRVIRGYVEEREKAFEIYDEALSKGYGGYLLDQERPNIFTLSLGNLNPGSEAVIEIDYVTLLDGEGPKIRFVLPTTISPRYIPNGMPEENGIPEGTKVNPTYATEVPYGLTLSLNIHAGDLLKSVDSPSHPIKAVLGNPAVVTLSTESAKMDRDFVLHIECRETLSVNRAYRCQVGEEVFLQLDLSLKDVPEKEEASVQDEKREFIFLLDCSGSMTGDSIREAKKALEICLRGLREGNRFNIYRFGSTYESLYKTSASYNEGSLQEGINYLAKIDADLGGTEILTPLQEIYSTDAGKDSAEKDIVLLTDGQVGNEDQVLKLAAENHRSVRMFPIGIGAGPNEYFIKGLARTGRGAAEFIYPGERIEPKVLRTFQKVIQTGLEDALIWWGEKAFEQSPEMPVIFMGSPLTVFARGDGKLQRSEKIVVKGKTHGHDREWHIDITEADSGSIPIPILWARERIRDLESIEGGFALRASQQVDGKLKEVTASIVDLSKKYGLLSSLTSFVAIEQRDERDKTTGEVVVRKIPALITVGWHGMGSILGSVLPRGALDFDIDGSCANLLSFPERRHGKFKFCDLPNFYCSYDSLEKPSDGKRREGRTDILLSLLSLQRADGTLELDAKCCRLLRLRRKELQKLAQTIEVKIEVDKFQLLSAALILEMLEQFFADRRPEWLGLLQKSREWLDRVIREGEPKLEGEELLIWAKDYARENIALR